MKLEMNQAPTIVLRRKEVERRTGMGRTAIYTAMKAGQFPNSIKLGSGRRVGWIEEDVQAWIDERISASRRPRT